MQLVMRDVTLAFHPNHLDCAVHAHYLSVGPRVLWHSGAMLDVHVYPVGNDRRFANSVKG